MKKNRLSTFTRTILIIFLATLTACVPGTTLLTKEAKPDEVKGTYTLLLYGCHYPDDVKDVAFLIDEGSSQPFEIYDIKTSFKVKKGVPAQQALSEAEAFIRCSMRRVSYTGFRSIPDGAGGILGYEVRPLFFPTEFGYADIMLINYSLLKDGMIRVYIKLDPGVEKQIDASGGDQSGSGR
jgi:hypothetical protein